MGLQLYEIDKLYYEALDEAIDQETGEIKDDSLVKFLDEIQEEKEKKILNLACFLKSLVREAEALEEEASFLEKRRMTLENQANSLEKYIESYLEKGEKLKDSRVSISWRKSTKTIVDLKEEDLLPLLGETYVKVETSYTPKKTEIKAAIESGEILPGCSLQKNQSLVVK